jgi:hypothetical protein
MASSHFAEFLSPVVSTHRWVNYEVCNPDGSPAKPGLRHYSHEYSLSRALSLVRHIQWGARTMGRDEPALVVWVEGETSAGAFESTTVGPCGQLSLLDYRTTPNTTTC